MNYRKVTHADLFDEPEYKCIDEKYTLKFVAGNKQGEYGEKKFIKP